MPGQETLDDERLTMTRWFRFTYPAHPAHPARMARLICAAAVLFALCVAPRAAQAQLTPQPAATAQPDTYPAVTFGTQAFLQYSADLHEAEGFNAFDVTRGFLDIRATMSPRIHFRFTPDVRPVRDADLSTNLVLRLAYASLQADINKTTAVYFGMHDTPWLSFEQSIDRYRVQGPMFAEREGLIPSQTDLGASLTSTFGPAELHVGVYNGEGSGRQEVDKYKSVQARGTVRPVGDTNSILHGLRLSGFYSHGWYARDRPRNVAIAMASYEHPHVVATAQYLSASDNPFVADTLNRRGLSFFGEVRQGVTGWAGLARIDRYDPNSSNDYAYDATRRFTFGGARWNQVGQGRIGIVGSFELKRSDDGQSLEKRLLAQTHVEF